MFQFQTLPGVRHAKPFVPRPEAGCRVDPAQCRVEQNPKARFGHPPLVKQMGVSL